MAEDRGALARIPRPVWLLGGTSLLNDLASEMIYPLLPAFVTRVLGRGAIALGVLDGLAETVSSALKLLSGYLAERPRLRAPLVVGGYALAAAVRPLLALSGAAWQVIALRGLDRVGKGARTAPRDTIIAEAAAGEIRGRAFGLHRAADHLGAIVGPLLAAWLIAVGLGIRDVFALAAIPGALAVAMAWVAVRSARGARWEEEKARTPVPSTGPAPAATTTPPLLGLRSLIAVLALAAFLRAPETLLILRAQDLGVAVAAVPLLWAALHVVRSAASYPGGVLADRWGAGRTLAMGWLLYAVLALAFVEAASAAAGSAVFLAFGLVAGLTESPERHLVAGLAKAGRQGRGFGWYHASVSAVALPGAFLFGWLYQRMGARWAFGASAGTTLLAVFALAAIAVVRRQREIKAARAAAAQSRASPSP